MPEAPLLFPGRLAIQQRVLPSYRAPFFDLLAGLCSEGLGVFAGQPTTGENISTAAHLQVAHFTPARNLHFLTPSSPFYQCWQAGLLNWLEAWDPQVLIVEANPRYASTPAAVRWMHARRRPVLGWGLGAPPLSGKLAGWRRRSRQALLTTLDGIIAYSRRGAAEYLAAGFPEPRVFVAPNAAAPQPVVPPPARPAEFAGKPVVLFVGRLQARKRVDHLLHACAALPSQWQPRLCIVGDGPARLELQHLAQAVYPQAEFTGELRGKELDPYFSVADVFVLPGTGGLAVQQAMAFGLPVIVAQGDGTQDDLVRSSVAGRPGNGWLIPPDDLPALTQALQAALADPGRLRQMGAESFRIVAEEANLEAMAAAFVRAANAVREAQARSLASKGLQA